MIVDSIADAIEAFVSFVLSLLPGPSSTGYGVPDILATPFSYLFGLASSLGVWVPWAIIVFTSAAAWLVRFGMATVSLLLKLYAMIRGGAS